MSELDQRLNDLYMQWFGWMDPNIVDLLLIGMVTLMFFIGGWMYATWPQQCGIGIMGAAGSLAVTNFIRMFVLDAGSRVGHMVMVGGCLLSMYLLLLARRAPESRRFRRQLWSLAAVHMMVAAAFISLYTMGSMIGDDGNLIRNMLTQWFIVRFIAPPLLLLAAATTLVSSISSVLIRATSRQP